MFKILIFIIGVLITITGIAACLSFFKEDEHEERIPLGLRAVVIVFGLVAIGLGCVYSQDVGEVVVLRSLGGNLAGSTTDAGFHFTAPWNDVITFDTRNNLINFYGKDTEYSYDGGSAEGPCITVMISQVLLLMLIFRLTIALTRKQLSIFTLNMALKRTLPRIMRLMTYVLSRVKFLVNLIPLQC